MANAQDDDREATEPARPLRNAEIDAHPMLDRDLKLMCRTMRTQSKKYGVSFAMMDFARICLHATAVDYASTDDGKRTAPSRELQKAAVLFVYEALKACQHEIIKQWPEFDAMLKQLEDLVALGLPT